jgi:hypothetical protein
LETEHQEVYSRCRLNERVEEDPKEAKAAAASFNAPIVGQWCRVTRLRSLRAACPLSSLN